MGASQKRKGKRTRTKTRKRLLYNFKSDKHAVFKDKKSSEVPLEVMYIAAYFPQIAQKLKKKSDVKLKPIVLGTKYNKNSA